MRHKKRRRVRLRCQTIDRAAAHRSAIAQAPSQPRTRFFPGLTVLRGNDCRTAQGSLQALQRGKAHLHVSFEKTRRQSRSRFHSDCCCALIRANRELTLRHRCLSHAQQWSLKHSCARRGRSASPDPPSAARLSMRGSRGRPSSPHPLRGVPQRQRCAARLPRTRARLRRGGASWALDAPLSRSPLARGRPWPRTEKLVSVCSWCLLVPSRPALITHVRPKLGPG